MGETVSLIMLWLMGVSLGYSLNGLRLRRSWLAANRAWRDAGKEWHAARREWRKAHDSWLRSGGTE